MDADTAYCLNTLILGALLGLIPAAIAHSKGKDFFVWWLFGAALFIVALPAAILAKPDVVALEKRQLQQGDVIKCPYCAEIVKKEARVCRYCGRELNMPPFQKEERDENEQSLGCLLMVAIFANDFSRTMVVSGFEWLIQ